MAGLRRRPRHHKAPMNNASPRRTTNTRSIRRKAGPLRSVIMRLPLEHDGIAVETSPGLRHLAQQAGGTVPLPELLLEGGAAPDEHIDADHVDIGQRPTCPRGIAEAEDGPDIALPGIGKHPF